VQAHWLDLLGATALRSVRNYCLHRMSVGGPTAVCELHHNEASLPATEAFASSPAACWGTLAALRKSLPSPPSNPIGTAEPVNPNRHRAQQRAEARPRGAGGARGHAQTTLLIIMLIWGNVTAA
jgi:hypothetical protein